LNGDASFVTPIDDRTVLFVSRAPDLSGPWLWAVDVEHKITRRLSQGFEHYTSVAASRDGRRVVATVTRPTAALWMVPILDREPTDADVTPHPVNASKPFGPRSRAGRCISSTNVAARADCGGSTAAPNPCRSGAASTAA
jgi:hypothetical protein